MMKRMQLLESSTDSSSDRALATASRFDSFASCRLGLPSSVLSDLAKRQSVGAATEFRLFTFPKEPGLQWSRSIILRKWIFEKNLAFGLSSRSSSAVGFRCASEMFLQESEVL